MAAKQRYFDVWIVESNTVYKEVPFVVVSDWVQQGRLLEDDKVKPSGTADWLRLGDQAELAPYVPRADPLRADDQAEALEPVGIDFRWKKPHDEEEGDVDMIPLIDVSLVLLIFFMLTASAVGTTAAVPVPETQFGQVVNNPDAIRIDITLDEGDPVYSVAQGDQPPAEDDTDLRDFNRLLDRLRDKVAGREGQLEVVINAHKDLKSGISRALLVELQARPFRGKIKAHYYGVGEREQP